ncbi:hypothetical protein AOQ84DRAFT_415622 [Glonium stellatum]|uniref:Uncharacterized protein n=1 Tax=Glonium stellatum TaxID=574774 RepID=A0A8E2ETQ7_9PEZI|nr:hypothetical protein AOQ84DRAFT_415622 [Glonium stellatum]
MANVQQGHPPLSLYSNVNIPPDQQDYYLIGRDIHTPDDFGDELQNLANSNEKPIMLPLRLPPLYYVEFINFNVGMGFVINHCRIKDDVGLSHSSTLSEKVDSSPIAGWIYAGKDAPNNSITRPQLTLLMCIDDKVPEIISRHYRANQGRQGRVRDSPSWVFLDMFIAFSPWSEIWDLARRGLMSREGQVQGKAKASSLLQLTRDLHQDRANVIALREDLRLHIKSVQKFVKIMSSPGEFDGLKLVSQKKRNDMKNSVEDVLQNLVDQQETSEVILHQFSNLLSLAFNIETVSQGLSVARLNILAFFFLPLSYIAGLFGMTTWTISVHWYPVWGLATLGIVGLLALLINLMFDDGIPSNAGFRLKSPFKRDKLEIGGPDGSITSSRTDSSQSLLQLNADFRLPHPYDPRELESGGLEKRMTTSSAGSSMDSLHPLGGQIGSRHHQPARTSQPTSLSVMHRRSGGGTVGSDPDMDGGRLFNIGSGIQSLRQPTPGMEMRLEVHEEEDAGVGDQRSGADPLGRLPAITFSHHSLGLCQICGEEKQRETNKSIAGSIMSDSPHCHYS